VTVTPTSPPSIRHHHSAIENLIAARLQSSFRNLQSAIRNEKVRHPHSAFHIPQSHDPLSLL